MKQKKGTNQNKVNKLQMYHDQGKTVLFSAFSVLILMTGMLTLFISNQYGGSISGSAYQGQDIDRPGPLANCNGSNSVYYENTNICSSQKVSVDGTYPGDSDLSGYAFKGATGCSGSCTVEGMGSGTCSPKGSFDRCGCSVCDPLGCVVFTGGGVSGCGKSAS